MVRRHAIELVATFLFAACASGIHVDSVAARTGDVDSIDDLMRAFYEVVNIAPDGPRQWARDRTLYAPWIRFVALDDPQHPPAIWTHQQLVEATEPLIRAGFREREIHRRTTRYGSLAHVDSTYETVIGTDHPTTSRGVNSLDLYFDGTRWWIANVIWQSESERFAPIPAELLP
jgi:hypothetical protein